VRALSGQGTGLECPPRPPAAPPPCLCCAQEPEQLLEVLLQHQGEPLWTRRAATEPRDVEQALPGTFSTRRSPSGQGEQPLSHVILSKLCQAPDQQQLLATEPPDLEQALPGASQQQLLAVASSFQCLTRSFPLYTSQG